MNNKLNLEDILPHKKPMILIDDIVDYSIPDRWLSTKVEIKENSLFYDAKIKGVSSIIGIEYMAQSIGCYAFLRKKLKTPKIGYLLGTRLYNNLSEKFELGKTYFILVKEIFSEGEINSFDCLIYNETKEEVASAALNVYQEAGNNE
ncbi:MAG: hypothetical protein LUG16_07270 [Candidatus Gastranaerophilales bacterium]|nr:hypothetical protein [Candidatus Gastranaerophilales bacterium]